MMTTAGRSCGECVVCCVYLRIEQADLRKAGMTQCEHLVGMPPPQPNLAHYTGGGCGIYGDRPAVCREYACLWLLGAGQDGDRPDRSLMLIDTVHHIEDAIECKPLAPEHESTPEAMATVLRICRETGKVGIMTNFYERRIVRAVGRPL